MINPHYIFIFHVSILMVIILITSILLASRNQNSLTKLILVIVIIISLFFLFLATKAKFSATVIPIIYAGALGVLLLLLIMFCSTEEVKWEYVAVLKHCNNKNCKTCNKFISEGHNKIFREKTLSMIYTSRVINPCMWEKTNSCGTGFFEIHPHPYVNLFNNREEENFEQFRHALGLLACIPFIHLYIVYLIPYTINSHICHMNYPGWMYFVYTHYMLLLVVMVVGLTLGLFITLAIMGVRKPIK